jgi:hypothetical protein
MIPIGDQQTQKINPMRERDPAGLNDPADDEEPIRTSKMVVKEILL